MEIFHNLENKKLVQDVFIRHSEPSTGKLTNNGFALALKDIGITREAEDQNLLFIEADLDEDGLIDIEEFSDALKKPSKLEQWFETLPLARLMACCVESAKEIIAISNDPVRLVSQLSAQDLDGLAESFFNGVKHLLAERVCQLKICYEEMERKASEGSDGSNAKFQTFTMSAGNVEDFYKGLTDRVG